MEFNDIQTYITENAENEDVKDLIKSFQQPITRDAVETWCKDGEGRSWLDRTCDLYSNKAVETARNNAIAKFKEEELPKIIEEELKKVNNKKKTPEQIELEELKAKFEALEKEKTKADMTSKYTKVLTEKGLNTDLINFVLGENDETTTQNIESIEKIINGAVDNGVKNKLSSSSYTPPSESNVDNSLNAQIASAMGVQ